MKRGKPLPAQAYVVGRFPMGRYDGGAGYRKELGSHRICNRRDSEFGI